MTVILNNPPQYWYCPNCDFKDVTHETAPHSRFHSCRGLRGLTAPMVPQGIKAKVTTKEREDYIGKEMVQTDGENRPVMSVTAVRDDGRHHVTVYAPCAQAKVEGVDT